MNLKYIVIYISAFILVLAGCDKSLDLDAPTFNVKGYTVADDVDTLGNPVKKVTFNFEGDAKLISVYPGEIGNDYAYAQGRELDYDALLMSFSTTVQYGTQPNQLSVWASTDFDGTYTPEHIHAANWTNITNRFTLAATVGSSTPASSGTQDISDLKVEGKPLYIGFKYVTLPQSTAGTQNTWKIRNFLLTGQSNIGPITLSDQVSAGWLLVNDGEIIDPGRAQIESGNVVNLRGNNVNINVYTETWAISKSISTSKANLGPDRSIAIKSYTDPVLNSYTYNYTKPGNYTVVFVAQNSTLKHEKSVIRTVNVDAN
ncbi:DUF5017 domain-containing protein (plasmid) [Pedobacter sp. BS3]|uniref:DUF5017 domain-containing protein n=1 Tax=Pedobacter sp. BS3 TaxID=2567937 RepID=UPI0011EBB239|nr:DUF5017 domain-containing protein [Pedobacter sp. BS3]TZF86277.1 DUF5017 domain-containing protein [Pedobacter sp. BS3]